jgi:bacteriocin-like protein
VPTLLTKLKPGETTMANQNEKPIETNQEIVSAAGVGNNELSEEELAKVAGGAPKETVTFEYGGLQIQYAQQNPDGKP